MNDRILELIKIAQTTKDPQERQHSLEILFHLHKDLIFKLVNQFVPYSELEDDIAQQAFLIFIEKGVDRYNPSKQVLFKTHLSMELRRYLTSYVWDIDQTVPHGFHYHNERVKMSKFKQKYGREATYEEAKEILNLTDRAKYRIERVRKGERPVYVSMYDYLDRSTDILLKDDSYAELYNVLDALERKNKHWHKVICMRWGLDGYDAYSYNEISEKLKTPKKVIIADYKQALSWVRNKFKAKGLTTRHR